MKIPDWSGPRCLSFLESFVANLLTIARSPFRLYINKIPHMF